MHVLSYIVIGVWAISAIALCVCILMHSGKGTGLSEMGQDSLGGSAGSSIIEKNLTKVTVVFAVIFIAGALLMMKFDLFPLATITG